MYIHGYQIHNVLNVYRKQLSQGSATKAQHQRPSAPGGDRVELTSTDQRQSIIDKVSAEIVDHMAQNRPQKRFKDILARHREDRPDGNTLQRMRKDNSFTYTTIDENNDKVTNTLPVKNFSPLIGEVENNAQKSVE